jgi:hypothetical protein
MFHLQAIPIVLVTLLLGACVTTSPSPGESTVEAKSPVPKLGPAEQKLADGIKTYDGGDPKSASAMLQGALELELSSKDDQVTAHKYLAFIDCVSQREKQCREEFRKALIINPAFDLQPAEAGHPLWGSVFRTEKERFAKQAMEADSTSATPAAETKKHAKVKKKKTKKPVKQVDKVTDEEAAASAK